MKKILIITLVFTAIAIFTLPAAAYSSPNFTMSWSFQKFNNPNARQVAINNAEKQVDLFDKEEDPIDRFSEGLERRLYSSAQREIVDMIMDEEEIPYGEFEAGNLEISVAEDPQTGEVVLDIVDVVSGDSTVITYSTDDWDTDYSW